MIQVTEDIIEKALSLPAHERANIAHNLIISLRDNNFMFDPEYEKELKRRYDEIENGKAKGRLVEEVFADIEAKYNIK